MIPDPRILLPNSWTDSRFRWWERGLADRGGLPYSPRVYIEEQRKEQNRVDCSSSYHGSAGAEAADVHAAGPAASPDPSR